MRGIVLACGNTAIDNQLRLVAQSDQIEVRRLPARPGKPEVDPVLAELAEQPGARLVVWGADADLAAVALRLLRTERLAEVAVGYVPTEADSAVAGLWGLPDRPERAWELALAGDPDPVPLIRDDVGGVLVGRGVLAPVRGVGYCDDEVVLRGQAGRVEVSPDPEGGAGLVARVVRRRLLVQRATSTHGRAFQIGCLPIAPVSDGVRHPRLVNRWTWYRHTEDLRLVRGLV